MQTVIDNELLSAFADLCGGRDLDPVDEEPPILEEEEEGPVPVYFCGRTLNFALDRRCPSLYVKASSESH